MSKSIYYIDRQTGKKEKEMVYHEFFLRFFYHNMFGRILGALICECLVFSRIFGFFQHHKNSKRKILPFVKKYRINMEQFEKPAEEYSTFNEFFTRKLKKNVRNFESDLIIPADGRYLFYQNIEEVDGFLVKGKKFSIEKLLRNSELGQKYKNAAMVIGRLAPIDYHRFHFPCDCTPSKTELINGPLYSVNPIAVKERIDILAENKRTITELKTENFGTILYLEIGATMVGTIHETYIPNQFCKKGEEKGYFSFGGSSLILLFEHATIQFDSDLLKNSSENLETLCLFGQSLGNKI